MERFSTPAPLPASFPTDIQRYFTQNPPSKAITQQKLSKVCKYFFAKHPIILVAKIEAGKRPFSTTIFAYNNVDDDDFIAMNPTEVNFKLWLIGDLEVGHFGGTQCLSSIFKVFHRCELTTLRLFSQNISWDEYVVLTASKTLEHVSLTNVIVRDEKQQIVTIDKILGAIPGVQRFNFVNFEPATFPPEASQAIAELPPFPNLQRFTLAGLRNTFNPNDLATFIRKNTCLRYTFTFHPTVTEAHTAQFKNTLDVVVQEWQAEGRDLQVAYQRQ